MAASLQFGPRFIRLFACALILSSAAYAAPQATVAPAAQNTAEPSAPGATTAATGTVKTSDGTPVPSATVRITNTDTNKSWVSWSDESGKFEFPGLPAGHYRVEASQLGFVKSSADVQLPAPANKPVAVVLRVATLAELNAPANPAAGAAGSGRRQFGGGNAGSGQGGNAQAGNGQGRFGGQGQNRGQGGPGGRGGFGGRGQLPAGVTNAIRQGMADGGFAQTDLTGEGGAAANGEETIGQGGGNAQLNAQLSSAGATGASSDAFLLQGTTGQGVAAPAGGPGGPEGLGGPGGFGGVAGLLPPSPGGPVGFGGGPGFGG